jgi:hypothetical protein
MPTLPNRERCDNRYLPGVASGPPGIGHDAGSRRLRPARCSRAEGADGAKLPVSPGHTGSVSR